MATWHLTCCQVCVVPCADGTNIFPIFGWSIAMVVVGGVCAVLVVVMVQDAWRAAHPSSPPAPRYPILICHPLNPITSTHTSNHIFECFSTRQYISFINKGTFDLTSQMYQIFITYFFSVT
jgi:hypothetical protein